MDKEKDEDNQKKLKQEDNNNLEKEIKKDEETTKEENIKDIDEDNNSNDDKKKYEKFHEKIKIALAICLSLVIVVGILVSTVTSKYKNIVYPKISLYGHDISKLSDKELSKIIGEQKKEIEESKIIVQVNNNNYELKIEDYVSSYEEKELAQEVISYGKDKNTFLQFGMITMGSKKDYNFDIKINKEAMNEIVDKIYNENSVKALEPTVSINGENIDIIEGKIGRVVDKKKLSKDIENSIINFNENNNLSVSYINENPKIKKDELKKVDTKISSYSTQYGTGGGRGKNVELATSKIDNLLLMPGDEFSYEKLVGPVTQANGYTYAPVISNGELVQGIGGGVCQVSSTIYNAQLKAGILPTERRNHSKPVNYVPRGLDATLASGSIDYKFKNTYEYPLVINTYTSGGKVVIEFWSNKDATKGIKYEAVGYASGKVANTYLYGYDSNNKRVYEKHIDTSVYR